MDVVSTFANWWENYIDVLFSVGVSEILGKVLGERLKKIATPKPKEGMLVVIYVCTPKLLWYLVRPIISFQVVGL